jgi:hypothetical protein
MMPLIAQARWVLKDPSGKQAPLSGAIMEIPAITSIFAREEAGNSQIHAVRGSPGITS